MKSTAKLSVYCRSLAALFLLMLVSACTQKNITVWIASPWQRVMRSTPPGDARSVKVKAAANEYEPFRIIVHNGGDKVLKDVNVTITDLTGKDASIPAENISLYRAHYLNIHTASNRTKNPAGWYPDALIPVMDIPADYDTSKIKYVASPFIVDTSQNAEIWCDLFVPAGTRPGIYRGKVSVFSGKRRLAVIPVELNVWDFELPEKISMISHFGGLNWESNRIQETSIKLMGYEMNSPDFLRMEDLFNKELLKHRAVPASPARIWPEWNEKEGIIDKGEASRLKKLVEEDHFNVLNIPYRFRDNPKKCKKYFAAMAQWLRGLGYLDISYEYLEDEPNTKEEYDIVREQAGLIRSADPGIRLLCTEQTVSSNKEWGDLYGSVDIWCPLWGLWDEKTARERLEKGEILWGYTALCQGPEGTPWWQIDMEPLNFRSPMWINWHYDITGFLYWASVSWRTATKPEDVWEAPFFRKQLFWGEGCLLYPGKPAGIDGFVPSIRLKLYRESAEDYEYMVMASRLGKSEDVDRIVDGIATSFQNWSHDPAAYIAAREKLAEIIVKNK